VRKIANGKWFLAITVLLVTSTTLLAQSLVSIDPDVADSGESLGVGITGLDTHFDQASVMSVWFSQASSTIYAYSYFPFDDTYMAVWFDLPANADGVYDLNVDDSIDGAMTLPSSFTINFVGGGVLPSITSINPDTAQQGERLGVIITGQGTHFSQASPETKFYFSQASPTSQASSTTHWLSDTILLVEFEIVEDAPPSLQDIAIYNDIDGMLYLYDSFLVTPCEPKITSVTPLGAIQGQSLNVTITGQQSSFGQASRTDPSGFMQGSVTTSVPWFSQGSSSIYSKNCFIRDGGFLTATFDIPVDANPGLWDVIVPKAEEHTILTLPNGFIITVPGDMTCDGMVNFRDIAVLAENWLEGTEP